MCHQNSSGSPFSIQILWNLKLPKGQLISKCLFGVLNSSKKQTKTIRPWGIIVVESNFLVRFLEEFKTPKRHFEINWPLPYYVSMSVCGNTKKMYAPIHIWIYELFLQVYITYIDILCENCKCKRKIPGGTCKINEPTT